MVSSSFQSSWIQLDISAVRNPSKQHAGNTNFFEHTHVESATQPLEICFDWFLHIYSRDEQVLQPNSIVTNGHGDTLAIVRSGAFATIILLFITTFVLFTTTNVIARPADNVLTTAVRFLLIFFTTLFYHWQSHVKQ
jgi:hypothetical protein